MLRKCLFYILLVSVLASYAEEKKAKAPKQTPVRTLLKEARTAIKNNRDQRNKEKSILEALKREGLTNDQKAEIYLTASALEHSLNDQENLKAYLKQKYDTAAYYNTMLEASRYAILCDSIDTLANESGKVKPRYRGKNRDQLLLYRYNIYQGGRFFLRKSDYKNAYKYMSLYSDLAKHPLLVGHAKMQNDTLLQYSTYYSVLSAYNSNLHSDALRYIDSAISFADSSKCPVLQEYKVRCLQALKKDDEWLAQLKYGVNHYPKHDYFFVNLSKYYEDNKMQDECLALADSMLEHVQDATIYWYTKSLMFLHKEQWLKCVEMADVVLQREPEHINALYNKAVSYVNEAADFAMTACNDVRNPKCRQDREHLQSLYRNAKQPSEDLRRLRPDAVSSWAPLLYRIYLNLNMGDEFSEIEKVIKDNQK